jgi:hypothetical protein
LSRNADSSPVTPERRKISRTVRPRET